MTQYLQIDVEHHNEGAPFLIRLLDEAKRSDHEAIENSRANGFDLVELPEQVDVAARKSGAYFPFLAGYAQALLAAQYDDTHRVEVVNSRTLGGFGLAAVPVDAVEYRVSFDGIEPAEAEIEYSTFAAGLAVAERQRELGAQDVSIAAVEASGRADSVFYLNSSQPA